MSKYIKLEDAIEAYNQAVTLLVESEMKEFNLGDFTECSFNTTQIKLIARMIESLPTIEVSEDAISRADAIKAFTLNSKGERIPFVDCDNFPVEFPLRYIVDTLAALPPADKPQGEWIAKDGVFYCSRCDNDSGLSEEDVDLYEMTLPNYCQDCGARMKGADDE